MCGKEHVVGLGYSTDEEAGEREYGKTKTLGEVLVCEGLVGELAKI